MKVYNCQYVKSSDVFKGLPLVWDALASRDNLPFSWGDNNHSLVDAETVARELDEIDCDSAAMTRQRNKAIRILDNLGQTYIDFEN